MNITSANLINISYHELATMISKLLLVYNASTMCIVHKMIIHKLRISKRK